MEYIKDDFKCECGREQSYAPSGVSGGIDQKEAESIGWVLIAGKWVCPFCNPALVKVNLEVFIQDSRGKRESCGKYETSIEDYVLCVNMRGRGSSLSDIQSIHIEFSGKVQP